MDKFFLEIQDNFRSTIKLIMNNEKLLLFFKLSITFSALYFVYFMFKLKRKRILYRHTNLGYLGILKPNINIYRNLMINTKKRPNSTMVNIIKKFYSYPNGITNFGNNCYINVLIQCLASNPEFILYLNDYLNSKESEILKNKDLIILKDLEETMTEINSDNSVLSPKRLINNINSKFLFEHDQQDSYELYHRLLEIINIKTEDKLIKNENPFEIEWESKLKCMKCSNVILKNENTLDISLSPDFNTYSVKEMLLKSFKPVDISDYTCIKCTLQHIYQQIIAGSAATNTKVLIPFFKNLLKDNISKSIEEAVKEIVDYCDEHNYSEVLNNLNLLHVKSDVKKYSEIKKYPKIITIHIHKVFFEESAVTNQIKIKFPENLIFNNDINYELTSFIEHFGNHNFGHYIAYRKFFSKWFMINDSKVRMIDKQIALEVSNPYILFYRQQDKELKNVKK